MLNSISGWITAVVSLLTLGAVSIDRVLCLILHLRYNTLVTVSRIFKTVAIMWIFSIAFAMVRFWISNDSWYFIAVAVVLMPFLVISVSTLKFFRLFEVTNDRLTSKLRLSGIFNATQWMYSSVENQRWQCFIFMACSWFSSFPSL